MVTTDKCGLMLEGFEKFVAEGGGVVEHSGGLDCGGGGVLLLDASHLHAEVFAGTGHNHSFRTEFLHHNLADLRCHALLNLQAARIEINQPGELAEADCLSVGDISHGYFAEKRQDVVFAQGIELYVLDNDHARAFVSENSVVNQFVGILPVAACGVGYGLGRAHGGLYEALASDIFSEQAYDGLIVPGDFLDCFVT